LGGILRTMVKAQQYRMVTLASATGKIERVVYGETEVTLEVCREDELRAALLAGRHPVTVGFKKRDIVSYGTELSVCA
jgi:hypothetical protein